MRKCYPGHGLALTLILVLGAFITIALLPSLTGMTSTTYLGSVSRNVVTAMEIAKAGMVIVETDVQNKLNTGVTVDATYTYPTTTLNLPSNPAALTTLDAAVGTYSAIVSKARGQSYLIQVTARVGGATKKLEKLVQCQSVANLKDIRIQARNAGDQLGYRVATAGDVNADGYNDVILSAPAAGGTYGDAYLIMGRSNAGWQSLVGASRVLNLDNINKVNGTYRIVGRALDDRITSPMSAGDVNGDGYDDLVLSSRRGDGGGSNAGEVYIIFGRSTAAWNSLTDASSNFSLASMSTANGTVRFIGRDADDETGYHTAYAGDVDNDGYDDIITGARFGEDNSTDANGEAFLIFGRPTTGTAYSWSAIVDASGNFNLDNVSEANRVFRFLGRDMSDWFGIYEFGTGDVNGDGYDDFMIGAQSANGNSGVIASQYGEVYLFFGRSENDWKTLVDASGFFNMDGVSAANGIVRFIGRASSPDPPGPAGDWLGYMLKPAGDIDGDGYDDFLMGADAARGNGSAIGPNGSGEVYAIMGRSVGAWTTLTGGTGVFDLNSMSVANRTIRFIGRAAGDYVAEGPSGIGDINKDGYDDLVIGAPNNNSVNGADAGDTTVMFGRPATGGGSWQNTTDASGNFSLTNVSVANNMMRFMGRAAGDQFGVSADALGDINGDGYDDFIIGAWKAEGGGVDSGEAYIFFGRNTKDWWSYVDASGNLNTATGLGL